MIIGIGFDLVDVGRFTRAVERHGDGFVETLFSSTEIAWCRRTRRPDEHFAARFAAREAVLKALGTGLVGRMSWKDMDVRPERGGCFSLALSGAVAESAARLGTARVHLALTTTRALAAAVVILEGGGR